MNARGVSAADPSRLRIDADRRRAPRYTAFMPRPPASDDASRAQEGDVNQSARRRRYVEDRRDPQTAALVDADAELFLHQSLSTPCLDAVRRCDGIYLETLAGQRLMDFHGNSAHQVGYGHPRVVAAVRKQLDELPFCPRRFTNQAAVDLARKLTSLAPDPLRKVLFAPGGAVAIGIALKLARLATGRPKTLSMWGAFHGASLEAASVGGEGLFRDGLGPLLPGTEHVAPAFPYRCAYGCGGSCDLRCANYLDSVLASDREIGAVVAEPVRCTTVATPPPGYWQSVRAACDRHGVLLVFDEIPTCLGRTGRMFACEAVGVTPDILVMGKGLGGGIVPMAAVLARSDLDVAGDRAIGHYTHEKSPVGCAAALATIECIEADGLLAHARDLGAHAMRRLADMQHRHALIGDVRGMGLLIGVELVRDRAARTPAADEAEAVMYECMRRGLSFKVSGGNVLTLTPPLVITRVQLDEALDILDASLNAVTKAAG
jgi:4-aminobutyrate aminotransferase